MHFQNQRKMLVKRRANRHHDRLKTVDVVSRENNQAFDKMCHVDVLEEDATCDVFFN